MKAILLSFFQLFSTFREDFGITLFPQALRNFTLESRLKRNENGQKTNENDLKKFSEQLGEDEASSSNLDKSPTNCLKTLAFSRGAAFVAVYSIPFPKLKYGEKIVLMLHRTNKAVCALFVSSIINAAGHAPCSGDVRKRI